MGMFDSSSGPTNPVEGLKQLWTSGKDMLESIAERLDGLMESVMGTTGEIVKANMANAGSAQSYTYNQQNFEQAVAAPQVEVTGMQVAAVVPDSPYQASFSDLGNLTPTAVSAVWPEDKGFGLNVG